MECSELLVLFFLEQRKRILAVPHFYRSCSLFSPLADMSDNPLTLFFPFLEKLMAQHRILSRKPSPCPLLLATTLLVSLALLPLAAGFLLPSLPSSPAIRQGKVTTYTLLVIWTHVSGTCGYFLRIAGTGMERKRRGFPFKSP